MQLADCLAWAQMPDVQCHFLAQVAQIIGRSLFVFGDDFVAGAVVAKRLTKRDVHIQGQRQLFAHPARLTLIQGLRVVSRTESVNKSVCCWV